MTFINRLNAVVPSMGTPIQNDTLLLKQGTALSGNTQQTTSLSSISPTLSKGFVRVKLYGAGGTSPTLTSLVVNVTDGTTFVCVYWNNSETALAPAPSITPAGTTIASADGHITASAKALTSAGALFTPAMVGQPISISNSGTGGAAQYTTIAAYVSTTAVTTADAAVSTTTTATVKLTSSYGNGGSDTAPGGIDVLIEFETDLNANAIDVLTTLGGTTPTALLDIEAAGTI